MARLGGDTNPIRNLVDDGAGNVSFNADVNGDFFGSTHDGTVTCAGPVSMVEASFRAGIRDKTAGQRSQPVNSRRPG